MDTSVGNIPWRRKRLPTPVSGLENSIGCIVHEFTKNLARLSSFHTSYLIYHFSCLVMSDFLQSLDCSTPGFLVHHQLPELTQTHVHSSQWCYPTISSSVIPFSSCLQSLPASRTFPESQLLASGGQSIGVPTSASVLPMNIQGWFPVGWTGLILLLSKGLSRAFSNTTVQKHQFFGVQLSCSPTLTSIHDHWKNHSLG